MSDDARPFYMDFLKSAQQEGLDLRNNKQFIEESIGLVQKHMNIQLKSLKMLKRGIAQENVDRRQVV